MQKAVRILLPAIFFFFEWSPLFSQGSGNVLTYNGSSQYIDLGTQVADNCRTIEFWFKPTSTINSAIPDVVSLIARDYLNGSGLNTNEFGFYFMPGSWNAALGGKLSFFRRVGNTMYSIYSNASSWQANVWYHVAGVIDPSSGMKLYINGVLQTGTDPSTQPIQVQTGSASDMVAIATWGYWGATTGNRFFAGEVDEVRFWTMARTQTEIRENMCRKINPVQASLRAYYRFDNTATTTLTDLTGNGFNGSLANLPASSWHYSSAPIGDTSTYVYPVSWTSQVLSLQYAPGDQFDVSAVTGSPEGAHIYRVASLPNVTTGLANPQSDYYGVFLAGTTGNYSIGYDYSGAGAYCGSSCTGLSTRNDNAVLSWTSVSPVFSVCTLSKTNESSVGVSYRAEYILTLPALIPPGILGSDTISCDNQPYALSVSVPGATFQWSTGSTDSAISVNPPGVYWVDVTMNGCTVRDSIIIGGGTMPVINLGNDTLLCPGDIVTLSVSDPGATYLWSNGNTDLTLQVSTPGTYWVTGESGDCRTSDTVQVNYLSADLGPDRMLCGLSNSYTLDAGNLGASYMWSTGATSQTITVSNGGTYWVQVTNANCMFSDTIMLTGDVGGGLVYIPNSFTPDNNGRNEIFYAVGPDVTVFHMEIYNRWGQLIFESNDINTGWDGHYKGNLVQEDTYVVKITYETSCSGKQVREVIRHVSVMR